jgi:hypothetical protein
MALRFPADLASPAEATGTGTVATLSLVDAYAQLSPADGITALGAARAALIVGQFAAPFSLEYLTPFELLRTARRSQAVDDVAHDASWA